MPWRYSDCIPDHNKACFKNYSLENETELTKEGSLRTRLKHGITILQLLLVDNCAGMHVTISHCCKVRSPVNDCKQILSSAGFVWRHKDILSVSLWLLAQWRHDGLIAWRRLLKRREATLWVRLHCALQQHLQLKASAPLTTEWPIPPYSLYPLI